LNARVLRNQIARVPFVIVLLESCRHSSVRHPSPPHATSPCWSSLCFLISRAPPHFVAKNSGYHFRSPGFFIFCAPVCRFFLTFHPDGVNPSATCESLYLGTNHHGSSSNPGVFRDFLFRLLTCRRRRCCSWSLLGPGLTASPKKAPFWVGFDIA